METQNKRAVDVVMTGAKRIYILIIKVNLFSSRCFLKEIKSMCSVFLLSYGGETLVKVSENLKKLWKHSPAVPTAFLVLPNLHSCFYNSIETRYMFSIS